MKKLFSLVLVALFLMGVVSSGYCIGATELKNPVLLGPTGGRGGASPVTELIKVRLGTQIADQATVASGDVMAWDTTSADGVTVTRCVADMGGNFAGVLVEPCLTPDSSAMNGGERNWAWMAVKGYCLAKIDTTESTTGETLVLNGATLIASFQTNNAGSIGAGLMSQDIGILLNDPAADTLAPVWLR